MRLIDLSRHVTGCIPAELVTSRKRWIWGADMDRMIAMRSRVASTEAVWGDLDRQQLAELSRLETRLVREARAFLVPLASGYVCSRVWRNTSFSPLTPYGDYIWDFTVQVIECLLALPREFRQGVAFGRSPAEPWRDANPYSGRTGNMRWDRGYILGIRWAGVAAWLEARTR